MILKSVSVETALAHQQAIQDSLHLLHCAHHLTDNMPEDLMIVGDLSVLLAKIEKEIAAARVRFEPEAPHGVKFETADRPQKEAPWRNERPIAPPLSAAETLERVESAPNGLLRVYGLAAHLADCLDHLPPMNGSDQIAHTLKAVLGEFISSGNQRAPATA